MKFNINAYQHFYLKGPNVQEIWKSQSLKIVTFKKVPLFLQRGVLEIVSRSGSGAKWYFGGVYKAVGECGWGYLSVILWIICIVVRQFSGLWYRLKVTCLVERFLSSGIQFGGNSIWASGEILLDQNPTRDSKTILQTHDIDGSGSSLTRSEIKSVLKKTWKRLGMNSRVSLSRKWNQLGERLWVVQGKSLWHLWMFSFVYTVVLCMCCRHFIVTF